MPSRVDVAGLMLFVLSKKDVLLDMSLKQTGLDFSKDYDVFKNNICYH